MKLFANFDLYKGVILGSLVLLPGIGWWIHGTREAIEGANRAVADAIKSDGHLERISKLRKQLELVRSNTDRASSQSPAVYFQEQVFRTQAGIREDDFLPNPPREEPTRQISPTQSVRDIVVKIDWPPRGDHKQGFVFTRDLLFAVLFNAECGARGEGVPPHPQIWKLWSLKATNASVQADGQNRAPTLGAPDHWIVSKMEFARREPSKR